MTVLSEAKHALTLNLKRFTQIDMSNIILTHIPAQSTLEFYIIITSMSFDYHVDCRIHQRNHLNPFISLCLSVESRSVLSNLSLVMEFLGIVFTIFVFQKASLARNADDGTSYSYRKQSNASLQVAIKEKIVRAMYAASTPSETNSLS